MAATAIPSTSYSSSRPPIISRFSRYRIPRLFRHRRRRKSTAICIRNESGDDFFTSFLSHLPQPLNSLNSLPLTALGFASGLALSLPKLNLNPRQLGEWILFTSPTPFNRFVLLRCPSISFEGAELLQDVNEKLVKQERHFVRLDSGRIPSQFAGIGWGGGDQKLEYSRVCVGTEDGGVIALDWPADLDLNEEHGLDSTVLIVPGSAEGSMGENVRDFVLQCLNRGLFPVVMNPRGCAGSPLTTPRLFTAGDSDDVSSAIQFLSRTRPWSTFMAVGWGFGANMLTKYLAEVGEKTPLTAATCIDNPFDLEEATRTCSGAAVNQKLTGGLINILKSNKGLFQGRSKDFDVDSALSAKSVRDFDTAISMISYGFETIEEFYSNSSSRSMVENIKVPVLFIQSDDGTVPLFSLPRGDIAENPFTSLLLCSSLPSNTASGNSVTMWSQELTIEWLMAVELALLKGRHPLLKDVDVTINPSKGLAIAEGWISESDEEHESIINLGESDGSNGYLLKPMKDVQHEYGSGIQLSGKDIYELQDGDYRQVNGVLPQSGLVNAEFDKQDSADAVEGDRGQVLQTAEVVMKMLDVTMPGTLKEEDKKKVLTAVDQGETLMKALQDAVPEDVRGKLTTSVSEILQTQGKNLNLDVLNIGQIANVSSELKMKINEKLPKKADGGSGDKSAHSSETISSPHDSSDWSSGNRAAGDKSSGEHDDTFLSQEKSVKSFASHDSQLPNSVSSVMKGAEELQNNQGHHESSMEDHALLPQSDDNGHVASTTSTSTREMPPGSEEVIKQDNRCNDGERSNWDAKENRMAGEVKPPDSWKENYKTDMPINESEGGLQSHQESPDSQPLQKQDTENENANEKSMPTNGSEGALQSHENSPDSQPLENQDNETKNGNEINMPSGSEGGLQSHEKSPDSQPLEKQDSETKNADEGSMPTNGSEGGLQSHQNPPDSQPLEKQNSETKKADERSIPPSLDQNKPSSDGKASTFSVSQALDAFAGLDDSTQVAVNSVFGVIEEMINQFEEKKEDADTKKKGHELKGNNHHSLNQNDNNDVENAKDGNGPESVDNNENHIGLQSNTSGISDEGMDQHGDKGVANSLMSKYPGGYGKINDLYVLMANKAYAESVYNNYLQKFSQRSLKRGDKHLDLDTTTSLFLDYIPEEGHWKLLERSGSSMDAAGRSEASQNLLKNRLCSSVAKGSNEDELIESSYIILDSDKQNEAIKNLQKKNKLTRDVLRRSSRLDDLTRLVKNIVLDTLHVEVSRKLHGVESEEMKAVLARDVEEVANAVALAVRHNTEHNWCLNSDIACTVQQGSGFDGGHIIETISSAVMNTIYLRRMLPVGVVVGSSLASLRKFFNVATVRHGYQSEVVSPDDDDAVNMELQGQPAAKEVAEILVSEGDECSVTKQPILSVNSKPTLTETADKSDDKTTAAGVLSRDAVMVGAVTAALGASALLQEQKGGYEVVTRDETPSKSLEKVKHPEKSNTVKLEEAQDDNPPNMVVSLAEKAMSVAAPVVPTKEDGEVDQERLVAMLAELGQKGGILKLVGKLALLWGGIRGAMSLTNRLISFLRIAERPLAQRILAFGCMVLILWSPVVVPFLPTLVQDWATKKSSRIAELVCTFGLYIAIAGLIVLWGKKIRGYENPLQQYGLDLTSSEKVQDLLIGLIGGIMLVLSIHSINALLGFVGLSWPLSLSSSPVDNTIKFQSWIKLVFLAGQGLVTAISIAFVEELFYRSWLTEEIAVDLGDHRGIILSGLAFSVCQSSLQAIPGLWLLSLSLAGARKRKQGSLYIPIGLHAGIMASCFVLQRGGFLVYRANLPLWMTGTHPFQPFSGIVGLVFSLLLALVLYPRQPSLEKEISATIHE